MNDGFYQEEGYWYYILDGVIREAGYGKREDFEKLLKAEI